MKVKTKTSYFLTEAESKQLRDKIQKANISLREAAKRIGKSAAYLCDILNGKRGFTKSTWIKLVMLGLEQVSGDETITYDGVIRIVWGKKAKTFILSAQGGPEDKYISLNDCLKKIGYIGFQECLKKKISTTVLVFFETYTSGEIYAYGQYGGFWTEYGSTRGFG